MLQLQRFRLLPVAPFRPVARQEVTARVTYLAVFVARSSMNEASRSSVRNQCQG